MGRFKFVSMLALVVVCLFQPLAMAQSSGEAIRNAKSLLSDACKLHGLLESACAESFTLRSACRLESTAEQLVEVLACPSHVAEARTLVDDCALWYGRTSIGVRRQGCLANNRAIAASLACTERQLVLLETSVKCLLRHGTHAIPRQQPHWDLPPTGNVPSPNLGGYPIPGHAFPGRPGAWVEGPFNPPASSRPGYPFNSEGLGEPPFGPSPFGQSTVDRQSVRETHYRQPAPSAVPGQRGQIARAVLELMLSELSR